MFFGVLLFLAGVFGAIVLVSIVADDFFGKNIFSVGFLWPFALLLLLLLLLISFTALRLRVFYRNIQLPFKPAIINRQVSEMAEPCILLTLVSALHDSYGTFWKSK